MAFEVQLSGQSVSETRQRTELYGQDGVETVWVTTGHPPWFASAPSVRVSGLDAPQFEVTGGAGAWQQDHNGFGRWVAPAALTFDAWVRALLREQVSAHEVTPGEWVFTTAAHIASYRATQADRDDLLLAAAEAAEKLAQAAGLSGGRASRAPKPGPAMPVMGRAELHPWAASLRARADARQSAVERQAQARFLVRRTFGLSELDDDG